MVQSTVVGGTRDPATVGRPDLKGYITFGASPRASLALMKVAQAAALFDGSEFVTPEHVQQMAVPVIAHRMVMDPQARFSGVTARGVVEELLKKLKVPA